LVDAGGDGAGGLRPGDQVLLVCQVDGWVDDDFPGWIRVRFHDAAGRQRSMVDKLPVFGLDVGPADRLPGVAVVRCVVVKSAGAESAVVVSTSVDHVVAEDGADEFIVPAASLRLDSAG
jgi:hypothetical protein